MCYFCLDLPFLSLGSFICISFYSFVFLVLLFLVIHVCSYSYLMEVSWCELEVQSHSFSYFIFLRTHFASLHQTSARQDENLKWYIRQTRTIWVTLRISCTLLWSFKAPAWRGWWHRNQTVLKPYLNKLQCKIYRQLRQKKKGESANRICFEQPNRMWRKEYASLVKHMRGNMFQDDNWKIVFLYLFIFLHMALFAFFFKNVFYQ